MSHWQAHDVFISGEKMADSKLDVIWIYFDTASFDEIERDQKIKFEAQMSLIGGTMGLFTGFSILSGVEIICFVVKLFFSNTNGRKNSPS